MNAPVISSVGPPPDLHAERIVDEMLRYLHNEYRRLNANAEGVLDVRTMGAPKGQHRAAARLKKALGDLVLDVSLQTAKRGKFQLVTTEWQVWNPALSVRVHRDKPVPAGAGLASLA